MEDMDEWLKQIDEIAAEMREEGRTEEEIREYVNIALQC